MNERTMENPHATSLPLLDEVKLQARVLLPVIRALRERLGKQSADELVGTALRQWSRDLHRRIGEGKADSARERWDAIWADLRPRIGNAAESERLRDDAGVREFNVTRCDYAEFFKALGEPELGRFLVCDLDFDIAEVGAPQVELTRTQTIMEGASYCDFRYRFRP
jgi:predicted ArsR family transcriptional regulator